jgi:hypothetical protein
LKTWAIPHPSIVFTLLGIPLSSFSLSHSPAFVSFRNTYLTRPDPKGVGVGKFPSRYPPHTRSPLKIYTGKTRKKAVPRVVPTTKHPTTHHEPRATSFVMRVTSLVAVCRGCRDDIVFVWHGRPNTEVVGRPCVALRTPDQLLCNCLGPTLSPARKQGIELLIGGNQNHPSQAFVFLAPASSSPSPAQTHNQLASGAITAQPVDPPPSTTDQKPALESAGLYGPVESDYPSLPSFPGKLRESLQLCAFSKSPAQMNGP